MKYLSILILLVWCSPANAQLFGLGQRSVERTVTYAQQPTFGLGSVVKQSFTAQAVPVIKQSLITQPVQTTTVKRTRRVRRRVPMTFVRTIMQKRCQLVNGQPVCQSYPVQTTETRYVEVWVDVQE